MSQPIGYWGIDIGQCALKAVRVELVDGKPTATAFDYVEHPKILSQPDADPDVLIREALDKFLSRNPIGRDEVAIGIPGQSGLARFVKLPPVEEKKIAEIVKFEAKQQIPFPLDEVVWDFQKVAGGDVVDGFAMETEVGLFALKRDVISRYVGYFSGSKIEVHTIQMSPLALVNYTTYDLLRKGGKVPAEPEPDAAEDETPRGKVRCVVVLDIGTEASNLIITDGGKIIWQRPIPLGGNNFTRALSKELKLTFAKAEHLKRNAAKSPELPAILKALKPVLQDFVGEVQRSLGYFTNTHRNAHVGYMVGLGSAFRLPGLQKYLAEKLSIEVKKPAEFPRLQGEAVTKDPLFVENILSFPVAYGLALQALGEARLTTNLLPAEIRTERLIRAKKPYGVAAAAALLLGTAGLALGYGVTYRSVTDPQIEKAVGVAKTAIGRVGEQETKFNNATGAVKESKDLVKAVVDGRDERLDWLRLNEVLAAALPRPGEAAEGGNLPAAVWKTDQGMQAYAKYLERMRDGVKLDDALDYERRVERGEHPKNLAMVNLEAVYARWVDKLPEFFAKIDDEVYGEPSSPGKAGRGFQENIARVMLPTEKKYDDAQKRDKPDVKEGGGWVVELRGYTDYHVASGVGAEKFIRDGLIANLQKMSSEYAEKRNGTEKVKKALVLLRSQPTTLPEILVTSRHPDSQVWFALHNGILSEVHYPTLKTQNLTALYFIVTDGRTFAVSEQAADVARQFTQTNPRALSFQQTNTHAKRKFTLTKRYCAYPDYSTVLINVELQAPTNYKLYVVFDPALANTEAGDNAAAFGGQGAFSVYDGDVCAALIADKGFAEMNASLVGANDGLQRLLSKFRLTGQDARADNGNVICVARIKQPRRFLLALSFADTPEKALTEAEHCLEADFADTLQAYETGWEDWLKLKGLTTNPLAAMLQKARTEK